MLLLDADICVPAKVCCLLHTRIWAPGVSTFCSRPIPKVWSTIYHHLPTSDRELLGIVNRCVYRTPADAIAGKYHADTQTGSGVRPLVARLSDSP